MDGLPSPRPAAGRLTLADLAILVGAFAVASALQRPAGGYFSKASLLSPDLFPWVARLLIHQLAIATAILSLWRRARFGGQPTAAEWVLILPLAVIAADYAVGAMHAHPGLPAPNGAAFDCFTSYMSGTRQVHTCVVAPAAVRWTRVGAALAVVAAGLAILRAGLRWLPATAKVAIIAALAMVLRWGPADVITVEIQSAIWPLRHLPFWVWVADQLAATPAVVLFDIPIAAALIGWRQRRTPAEWLATAVAALLIVYDVALPLTFASASGPGAPSVLVYRALILAGKLISLALAALIAWRLGPAWNRWIGAGSPAPDMGSATPEEALR